MTGQPTSAIYAGEVMHKRFRPFTLAFRYKVWQLLLDLDEIESLAKESRIFRHNKKGLVAFFDKDHGPRDGSNLKLWIERQLDRAGLEYPRGKVLLMAMPRVLGYAFNPLSIWFCQDDKGALRAVLYEVRNTFGDKHGYLLPLAAPLQEGQTLRQSCDKAFHVSPFIGPEARYDFRLSPPTDKFKLVIDQSVAEGRQLLASWTGERRPLKDRHLARLLAGMPLVTFKVIAAIHWQALKLWLKGAKFHRRSKPPAQAVSVIAAKLEQPAE